MLECCRFPGGSTCTFNAGSVVDPEGAGGFSDAMGLTVEAEAPW